MAAASRAASCEQGTPVPAEGGPPSDLEPKSRWFTILHKAMTCAYDDADWNLYDALHHQDARVEWPDGQILTLEELIDAVASARRHPFFCLQLDTLVEIDEHASLVEGLPAYGSRSPGPEETQFWFFTIRDGLLYRCAAYPSERDARAAYVDHGITLGL